MLNALRSFIKYYGKDMSKRGNSAANVNDYSRLWEDRKFPRTMSIDISIRGKEINEDGLLSIARVFELKANGSLLDEKKFNLIL